MAHAVTATTADVPQRLLYVVGARPNYVKMAPVIASLRARLPAARHVLVDTGQHYDPEMSAALRQELGIPVPDHALEAGSASHAVQTARILERIEPVLETEEPDLVLVAGDVNSTLAAALAAAKLGIQLGHIESGLRSFDRKMPEEINRVVTDELSAHLFIHSHDSGENLRAQGIGDERIHFVGNTMIDSLVRLEPEFRRAGTASERGLSSGGYLLVTLHRPELVDGPLLYDAMTELARLAGELPVVFPVHPRTRARLAGQAGAAQLHLLPPLGYIDFLALEASAAAVLTDSGGVQEETTYLGIRCFTLREHTDRPVTVQHGTNTLLGLDPSRIPSILDALAAGPPLPAGPPPGWDGRAGHRVADVLCGTGTVDEAPESLAVHAVDDAAPIP